MSRTHGDAEREAVVRGWRGVSDSHQLGGLTDGEIEAADRVLDRLIGHGWGLLPTVNGNDRSRLAEVVIRCARCRFGVCGAYIGADHEARLSLARQYLAGLGWLRRDGQDICPGCRRDGDRG